MFIYICFLKFQLAIDKCFGKLCLRPTLYTRYKPRPLAMNHQKQKTISQFQKKEKNAETYSTQIINKQKLKIKKKNVKINPNVRVAIANKKIVIQQRTKIIELTNKYFGHVQSIHVHSKEN